MKDDIHMKMLNGSRLFEVHSIKRTKNAKYFKNRGNPTYFLV